MCRLHFANDCFNGACKRLLETAVPTLRLNLISKSARPKCSPTLQLSENEEPADQTIAIAPASLEPIKYESEYLENASSEPKILNNWRTDQRFSKDIEMTEVDDENIDNERENYIELYEEEDLFEAEDGKQFGSKT